MRKEAGEIPSRVGGEGEGFQTLVVTRIVEEVGGGGWGHHMSRQSDDFVGIKAVLQ